MENKRLLYKVFDCCGTKILYNGFDNTLAELDSKLQSSLNDVNSTLNNECFAGISCEHDVELVKLKSNSMLRHVVISMTEDCNLRCKYCGYHDNRFVNSNHLKTIDEITLRKALDFIADHSMEAYDTLITFYGGEPLLKFDLIKFAISYLEKKNCLGHKYNYRISTNGTLLESTVVDYLVSKDIICVVSLDGPVYIHDRYRVYKNSTPTYSDIINILKRIAKKHPNYYKNNIRFNAVISPPYNPSSPKDFFEKSNVFRIDVAIGEYFRELLKTEYGIKTMGDINQNLSVERVNFRSDEIFVNMRFIEALKKYVCIGTKDSRSLVFPSGFCYPLVKRIHIGIDGKIILCERVDENNSYFHFGDVFMGYDFSKIDYLYKYTCQILAGNCDVCWAFRFYDACFATLGKIGYNGDYCKKFRKVAEQGVLNYLNLKFYNKRFDSIMQSISTD
jgi:uncharacterized protein